MAILRPSTHRLPGTSWPRVDTTGPQGTFQNSPCSWQRSSVIRGSVTWELCLGWALQLCVTCREPPGCTQSVTRSWDERETRKAALPHMGLPRGPNMSPPEPPGPERNLQGSSSLGGCPGDKVTGQERNLQGNSSPRGCPRGPVCPFPPSVSLLLGFLLIFGNDNI